MIDLTLTAENQVTLTQSLVEHLGVKPGGKITLKTLPDGSINLSAYKKRRSIMELMGALEGKTDVKLTDEELQQAIIDGYVESGMRGLK